jgi:hypothetical protein
MLNRDDLDLGLDPEGPDLVRVRVPEHDVVDPDHEVIAAEQEVGQGAVVVEADLGLDLDLVPASDEGHVLEVSDEAVVAVKVAGVMDASAQTIGMASTPAVCVLNTAAVCAVPSLVRMQNMQAVCAVRTLRTSDFLV